MRQPGGGHSVWAAAPVGELLAWALAAAAALFAFGGVYALTQRLRPGFLRSWLRVLSLALMLTPAPVPSFPGNFSPAFVVAVFEALFQIDGAPQQALKLLAAAGLAAAAWAALWSWLGFGRKRRLIAGVKLH